MNRTRTARAHADRTFDRSGAARRPGSDGNRLTPPVESFAELALPAPLLATLGHEGVRVPFPIQAATLPGSLDGRDVLGRTGSGKTLAFGLPVLARTAGRRAEPRQPLALILVPTRELAQQVTDSLAPYARSVSLRLVTVVGRQAGALRAGAEVVVATPGRLKDLVDRGDCRLTDVDVTVLDEADRMTGMGFMPQVTALLDQVRPGGQRMLFSAAPDRDVDLLVRRYLTDPVVHSVGSSDGAVARTEHRVTPVRSGAQAPSGISVVVAEPVVERPRLGSSASWGRQGRAVSPRARRGAQLRRPGGDSAA